MTLIATYKKFDIPVLLGDVLITGGGKESYCKKINKVSSNFVIGWTGRKLNAVTVLKPLFETFGNKKVSMKEVEEFLLSFDTSQFIGDENENKLLMSGWIIDDEEYSFLWNGNYNNFETKELFFDEGNGIFLGSGSNFFEGLLQESEEVPIHTSNSDLYFQAVGSVLKEVCALTNGEYPATNKSWRNGFGFAYEVLIYDGNRFNYLDNILYLTVDVQTTKDWEIIKYSVVPYIYHHKVYGNISLFQVSKNVEGSDDIWQNYVGKGYGNDVKGHLMIETAIWGKVRVLSYKSQCYCLTIRIINQSKNKVIPGFLGFIGNEFFTVEQNTNLATFKFSPTFHSIIQNIIDNSRDAKWF